MHRRNFLKIVGLSGAGTIPLACGADFLGQAEASPKRIVVVGAGLAGLAAAQELYRQGHDVVVLEGRDRIGGRIWTSTQWSDLPLDLGASWIHGIQGNPLTDLADQLRAPRLMTSYGRSMTYNTSGQPLSTAETDRLQAVRAQVYRVLKQAQGDDRDTSLRQALTPLMGQFDPASEDHRFINFILNSEIEHEYSGSAARLSAHWYDSDQEFGGEDAIFVPGFRVIPELLAQGVSIQRGQVVQAIQWQPSPVRVMTQTREWTADHVVVTLPLGVLQTNAVQFTPALPRRKQQAIAQLGMGVLNKCYLRFPEVFWPSDVDWLEYVPANHGEWTEWVSFQRAANQPILMGLNAADRGREIEAWPDQQIVASALETLRKIYGSGIPTPTDYQITRWATDPFSRGAYSYYPVGAGPELRQDLAAPLEGAVFFAGEATHPAYFGTAHGAYLSGLRVATEILQL
jgi:monoamine oxidase